MMLEERRRKRDLKRDFLIFVEGIGFQSPPLRFPQRTLPLRTACLGCLMGLF